MLRKDLGNGTSHLLAKFGGLFLFNCNYDVNDILFPALFYFQRILKWWSEFREDFASVYVQRLITSLQGKKNLMKKKQKKRKIQPPQFPKRKRS